MNNHFIILPSFIQRSTGLDWTGLEDVTQLRLRTPLLSVDIPTSPRSSKKTKTKKNLPPSISPTIPSSPSCRVEQRREAGMSKAHVRRRKGFCGGRRDEAVTGNAVSGDTRVSRASLCLPLLGACPLLPCLITPGVRYYRCCQGLDVASLLACAQPSFDTVPRRLRWLVLMCRWRACVQKPGSADRGREWGHMRCFLRLKIGETGCARECARVEVGVTYTFPARQSTQLSQLKI